jgi:hypothetical protein
MAPKSYLDDLNTINSVKKSGSYELLAKASGLRWNHLDLSKTEGVLALATKASGLGWGNLDLGKNTGVATMVAKASGLGLSNLYSGNHTGVAALAAKASGLGWWNLDLGKNTGVAALVAKSSGLGWKNLDLGKNIGTAALAAKASGLGWGDLDLGKNTGVAALLAKASTVGITSPILRAAMRGIDIKEHLSIFGLASKVAASALHNTASSGDDAVREFEPVFNNMLTSLDVEKAFEHLLEEDDFEATAIRVLSDQIISGNIEPVAAEIEPYQQNQSFFEWYDKLRPVQQQGISLLLAFIIGILVNLTTPYVDDFIHGRPHETKAIVKAYKSGNSSDSSLGKEYRFVSATRLHIREKPRTDSAIIATATLGKVVKIEYKKQAWVKVSYLDENDDPVTGWTLLRYVSQFKH